MLALGHEKAGRLKPPGSFCNVWQSMDYSGSAFNAYMASKSLLGRAPQAPNHFS